MILGGSDGQAGTRQNQATSFPAIPALVHAPSVSEREPRAVTRNANCVPVGRVSWAVPPTGAAELELSEAALLSLADAPGTPEASALAATVCERITLWEEHEAPRQGRYRRRPKEQQASFQVAVGAALGGVLRAWAKAKPHAVSRSLDKEDFTAERVSFRAFQAASVGMVALDLLHHAPGIRFANPAFPGSFAGHASRWWPTAKLLRLVEEHGIGPDDLDAAFRKVAATKRRGVLHPVILRSLPTARDGKAPGPSDGTPVVLPQDDPELRALVADVAAHNALAAVTEVEGCDPPQWHRIFHHVPGHGWSLHGRMYATSRTLPYQTLSGGEEARTKALRIAGEPVAEIDVQACQLRLLYALLNMPLPEGDPYAVPGLPREVVKAWITQTIGTGKRRSARWSSHGTKEAMRSTYPAVMVRDAVEELHPILKAPEVAAQALAEKTGVDASRLLPGLLCGIEARIFADTLRFLRERSAPVLALPMHDGIIVPVSAVEIAAASLCAVWAGVIGGAPVVLKVLRGS